jgi:hypothetical protein
LLDFFRNVPFFVFLPALLLGGFSAFASDPEPYVPHKSPAPLYPGQAGAALDAVSPGELKEINGEFGGLLYMAQNEYPYERWPGKEMSDCREAPADGICRACELIMGHVSADYYFYQEEGKQRCVLKQVDARLAVADPEALKQFRRTAQRLFDIHPLRGTKPASNEPGWSGSGSGWKWETGDDLAYLYMNTEEATANGQGAARFQWRRMRR